MRLKDKVAVITGAASGIGQGTAFRFAEEGAKLVLGDVSEAALEQTVKQIKEQGGEAVAVVCDVANTQDIEKIMSAATEHYGSLDILVNNVGIGKQESLLELSESELDRSLAVNFKGMVLCAKAAATIMAKQRSGVIISTSSGAGIYGTPGNAIYAGTKSAILIMSKSWAKELGPLGIRVNCVVPGPTRTAAFLSIPEEQISYLESTIPMQRLGDPRDLGNGFVFLASDEASFVNGAALEITGGSTG
ncbi:MAG: SDR family NAD(P)-dependent oxidoreductase [Gammaproteobacteria bacterium]|nr:SDR family NAD(P)-dependent oxidoreductase [Gammaproteobacteria bacterium]MCY4324153.1 SDR family NAD(P)-dependent oxidoreductase [Gammaproteobacteria bacterium]